MTAICKVTNGVDYVSLIGDAFYISGWRPSGIPFKSSGYWQDSVFGEGRRLTSYTIDNVSETITLSQTSISQDAAIEQANKLAKLLIEAADFSTHPKHNRRPVYLEAKASSESNTRYARIHMGTLGEYGNPFAQPFLQPNCRAAVQDFTLIIERGPWLESPPGEDTCQYISPTGKVVSETNVNYYTYLDLILANQPPQISEIPIAVWPLNETSGTTAFNYSGAGSALDGTHDATNTLADLTFWNGSDPSVFIPITTGNVDIYSAAFDAAFDGTIGSLIAWVNTSGPIWTGGNDAYFVNLQVDGDNYLRIYHPSSPNDSITFVYTVGGFVYSYIHTNFDTAAEWFSVGMSWSSPGLVKFYVNGALVYYDVVYETWSGSLTSTTAVIGARINDGTDSCVSNMAYVGIWDKVLTEEDFGIIGIPSEERLEGIDFNVFDCEDIYAFVASKRNDAKLTHAFYEDNSLASFGSNMINDTPPITLLPATIAANDAIYFGIQTTSGSGLPDGPFNSVVLDISTAAAATTYVVTWEYYNGAWTTLSTLNDNTNGLQNEGIYSVYWDQPADWTTVAVNSVTAYWVRMRITTVTGGWTQPIARDEPYTIVNNFVIIPESEIGGSLPALARIVWDNDSTGDTERAVIGLRSTNLAPSFTSYLNLGPEQNQPGTVFTDVHADVSVANDTTSPTGRITSLVYSAGSATVTEILRISMLSGISGSFLGNFKAFIIYRVNTQSSVAKTEFGYRVTGPKAYGDYTIIPTGDYITSANNHTVHEIGEISLRPDTFFGDYVSRVDFVWRSDILTGLDVDFYALVLIPTDEWFGDFDGVPISQAVDNDSYLSVDGTRYPNLALSADIRSSFTDTVSGSLLPSHNGPPIIPYNDEGRFHFLFMTSDASGYYESNPSQGGRIRVFRNRRYHYGRGSE